jgi:hypothetical protein
MTLSDEQRARVWLYIRMSLAAGLLGIGYGYYMQVMGRIEMIGFLHFEFAVRGIIVGMFFWALQIFVLNGPKARRLNAMSYGPKVFFKTVAFLLVIGIGVLIGDAIFNPQKYFGN